VKKFYANNYFPDLIQLNNEVNEKEKSLNDSEMFKEEKEKELSKHNENFVKENLVYEDALKLQNRSTLNSSLLKQLEQNLKNIEDKIWGIHEYMGQLKTTINKTQQSLIDLKNLLPTIKEKLKLRANEVESYNTFLWTITNVAFVIGGMIGTFTSKYLSDYLGRKKGILVHYVFTLIGAILAFIAPYVNSPLCVILSRFFYGVQGGMACGLIPTYLNEISPNSLRGSTGVLHQLSVTIGILVSQLLGFRQLLGIVTLLIKNLSDFL
jgi:hypothetical protein